VTTLLNDRGAVTCTAEGGAWLTLRRREPALSETAPADLLRLAEALPGNLRYATDADGTFLLGEVRSVDGESLDAARERLLRLLDEARDPATAPAPDEAIEAALDSSGLPWSRRASSCSVAFKDRLPREVVVVPVPGGARAESVLTEWDEIAPVCREALIGFLLAAQAGLRFARCEIDERHARIVAFAATERLDAELPHALLGVAAGCELMAREAEALLWTEVAEIYLDLWRITPEREDPTQA
jgi:hypothetical protein